MNENDLFKTLEPADSNYLFEFGKYKGLPISAIINKDPYYLLWLENQSITFIMNDELYKEVITEVFSNRSNKVEEFLKINKRIENLSEAEIDRKRKKYWVKKKEQEKET